LEFTITSANPLDHAAEIKQLFLAHGRPEFPDFFERVYAAAVQGGARSWLGRDRDGHLVMHMACFPHRFTFGAQEVVGGHLVNGIAAQAYRTFFPVLALVRRALEDAKALGTIDFLYSDSTKEGRAVLRAPGFAAVGTLIRYVLPVADKSWLVDGAIRAFHACVRVANPARSAGRLVRHAAAQFSPACFEAPQGFSPRLRPFHDPALYASRLEGYPSDSDCWFTFHDGRPTDPPAAGILVRGPERLGVAAVEAVRRDPRLALASLLPRLVPELRRGGCTRLEMWAPDKSAFGRELRRAGFVPRPERRPLVAAALTATGEAVVREADNWEITRVDFDRPGAVEDVGADRPRELRCR
jgi:hypothetical protein